MNERIQDLTDEELQAAIDDLTTVDFEHNTIAQAIVKLYQKELNERTNSRTW